MFNENNLRVNSLDYSPDGATLISSSDSDSINIYDCEKGTQKATLNSKKYGCDQIRYTHGGAALHASTKVDDTIRYLSLHDNKYIRYFQGHAKKVITHQYASFRNQLAFAYLQVVTLCMSPVDDTFLSGSLDKTIRLWDLRSPNCQGLMHLVGRPVAAFDPEGKYFLVYLSVAYFAFKF